MDTDLLYFCHLEVLSLESTINIKISNVNIDEICLADTLNVLSMIHLSQTGEEELNLFLIHNFTRFEMACNFKQRRHEKDKMDFENEI